MTTLIESNVGRRPDLSPAKQMLLAKRLGGEAGRLAPTIPRRNKSRAAPLSFAQEQVWFFHQLEPQSPLYNMSTALRMEGHLDLAALQQALDALVVRHEPLRTRFFADASALAAWAERSVEKDGEPVDGPPASAPAVDGSSELDQPVASCPSSGGPVQWVADPAPVPLPVIDLRRQVQGQREEEARRLLKAEVCRPFDLAGDLLIRGLAVRLGAEEWWLLLVVHHLAGDGWSWSVLFRELGMLYEGFQKACPARLPELPLQFTDYAAWQRTHLDGPVLARLLDYWKAQLQNAPPILDLPADHPRPAVQTFHGAVQSLTLNPVLLGQLQELSRRSGTTLFMTLLAAFQTLLHRYTQQADLLVGVPIAGRTQVECEPLIGFFVNTLVLRADLAGDPTFEELLGRVQTAVLGAYEHQELPFEKLVEALHPKRSSSYQPLIQVVFVFQNVALGQWPLPGLKLTPLEFDTGTAKFDLTMSLAETANGLVCQAEYNTALFEAATIQRLLAHYQRLLEDLTAHPDRRLSELEMLTPEEHHQLQVTWNQTRTDYPRTRCIHELFEEQAARIPAAVAVEFEGQRLHYGELNRRANQLAHHLRQLGVGAESLVGISVERSLEMIVGLLAILKAGGAYVPLDPAYPPERLRLLCEETEVDILLTQERFRQTWQNVLEAPSGPQPEAQAAHQGLTIICLDSDTAALAGERGANLPSAAKPEYWAYVSFTSGSTGKPKGVCIPHRGVVRLVKATHYARFKSSDVFLQLAPLAFDASTLEIWGPLLNGGLLVIYPPQAPTLAELGEFIERHRITTLWLTAGLFAEMVEEQLPRLRGVRQLLSGGDVLSVRHVRQVLEQLPDCRLINGYGPTENTTFTCCHTIELPLADGVSVPIGRPVSNTQVYVLDAHCHLVPIGVPGELYMGGDGLADGYLHQPELTAEKFVPHPFSPTAGERLYRSGDWVRWRADGTLEFLGRMDTQVKINGFRVEIGEVEAALVEHPAVREAAVTAHTDTTGQKRLMAYYVLRDEPEPTSEQLSQYLNRTLPSYMVPAGYARLEALPLNANGKVDRAALAALVTGHATTVPEAQAPTDSLERELVRLWEVVLGVRPIGVNHDFFALGGHSLLALRLIAQVERTLGHRLPASTLFQYPTVAQMAQTLRGRDAAASESLLVEIQPRGVRPPLFLVHGAGGGMFWGYGNLARYLGPDQPVLGLRSKGTLGQTEDSTIAEMAAHYLELVRAHQPHGPYALGGYCFGGNVAYEIARLLRLQGEPVALLLLMNCTPPNSSYTRPRGLPGVVAKGVFNLVYWAGYLVRLPPEKRRAWLGWRVRVVRKKLREWIRRAPAAQEIALEDVVDIAQQTPEQRQLWSVHIHALFHHRHEPYPGHLTLFRTRGHPLLCSFERDCGWGRLAAGGVTVKLLPGGHESILDEPHAQAVAKELKECLAAIPIRKDTCCP